MLGFYLTLWRFLRDLGDNWELAFRFSAALENVITKTIKYMALTPQRFCALAQTITRSLGLERWGIVAEYKSWKDFPHSEDEHYHTISLCWFACVLVLTYIFRFEKRDPSHPDPAAKCQKFRDVEPFLSNHASVVAIFFNFIGLQLVPKTN